MNIRHEVWEARKAGMLTLLVIQNQLTGSSEKPACVPILMYHSINDDPIGEPDISVKTKDFAHQMKYLADNGYTPIDFNDLKDAGKFKKPIIITFDDGYADNYKNAYPILKKHNFKATYFVVSSYIDLSGYLTEKEMLEMGDIISFQSHTVSHRPLSELNAGDIDNEMSVSKEKIFKITNKAVNVIAYPGGDFNVSVLKAAARYYHYAVTTEFGYCFSGSPNYVIRRIAVSRFETMKEFISFIT